MFPRTPKSRAVGPKLDLSRCAANGRDRHHLYHSFLDALGCEEQAARQLELDAGVLGAPKGDQS